AVRRIKSFAGPLPMEDVSELFHKVCRRLEMNFAVQLLTSALVEVPTVIGWLRPAVIMPFGCLAGLSTTQIEALLAHELAHIKRHDYLVNVLQMAMETMFFYHPLVWWVSKQIRREREYCCDDLALTVSENPLAYAKTLSLLEEQRSSMPIAALGADGGSLVLRVRRLLGCNDIPPFTRMFAGTSLSIVILATVLACIAPQGSWAVGSTESNQHMTGYANLSARDLADLQHYGVTAAFANSINAIGLGPASIEQLVSLNQYGVNPQYAEDVKRVGLVGLTLEDVIHFHQYGVSPEYVAGMYAVGFRKPEQILQLQQEGISVAQVSQLQRAGYRGLSPGEMVSLIHPK
ncbi:MAG: M56 family metallopeptidase, partial [Acidobacteriaceae bacterium]